MGLAEKEIEGVKLCVDVANKKNMLFIKGLAPKEGDIKEQLLILLKHLGDISLG